MLKFLLSVSLLFTLANATDIYCKNQYNDDLAIRSVNLSTEVLLNTLYCYNVFNVQTCLQVIEFNDIKRKDICFIN